MLAFRRPCAILMSSPKWQKLEQKLGIYYMAVRIDFLAFDVNQGLHSNGIKDLLSFTKY